MATIITIAHVALHAHLIEEVMLGLLEMEADIPRPVVISRGDISGITTEIPIEKVAVESVDVRPGREYQRRQRDWESREYRRPRRKR